jgi:signal transduction histidine kinase/CheY-like chemotaxis protein
MLRRAGGAPNRVGPTQWREVLLDRLLRAVAVLGTVVAIPSAIYGILTDVWAIGVLDVVAVAAVWALALLPGLSYRLKATAIILVGAGLGVGLFLLVAPVGAMYLVIVPLFAAIFFGHREAVGWFAAVVVLLFVLGLVARRLTADPLVLERPMTWLVVATNLMLVAAIAAFATGFLLTRFEQELERSEQLSEALEDIDDAIFITDRSDAIVYRNEMARHLDEFWAADDQSVLTLADLERRMAVSAGAGAGSGAGTLERPFHVGGDGPARYASRSIASHASGSTVVIVRDVTHQLAEEEQRRRAERLRTIGLLAAGTAHDFNNALTTIRGMSELLLADAKDPTTASMLGSILTACDRARDVVRQLMVLGQQRPPQRELVSIAAVVNEAMPLLRTSMPPGATLLADLDDRAWVFADASEVHHLVTNLVTNAAKAVRDVPEGVVHVAVRTEGEEAVLTVRDNGTGIAEDRLAEIFEPFNTSWTDGDGTGLGLSSVQATAQSLGGRVQVTSTLGAGTAFVVTLPARPDDERPVVEPPASSGVSRSALRVLVVDDEPPVARVVADHLRDRGDVVSIAVSVAEAEDHLRTADVDVLVTDLTMPGRSGVDLVRRVRLGDRRLAIVLMTGRTDLAGSEMDEVEAVLEKPFSRDELYRQVDRAHRLRT